MRVAEVERQSVCESLFGIHTPDTVHKYIGLLEKSDILCGNEILLTLQNMKIDYLIMCA